MHREEAVRWADVLARGAEVCSRVGLEPAWGAAPAPAGSSVGQAFRQSVCQEQEAVHPAVHSAVSTADCRAVRVRHPATEPEAEPAQSALVLSQNPASRKLPRRQAERLRSQIAKN
jgi:hypothetical protein